MFDADKVPKFLSAYGKSVSSPTKHETLHLYGYHTDFMPTTPSGSQIINFRSRNGRVCLFRNGQFCPISHHRHWWNYFWLWFSFSWAKTVPYQVCMVWIINDRGFVTKTPPSIHPTYTRRRRAISARCSCRENQ